MSNFIYNACTNTKLYAVSKIPLGSFLVSSHLTKEVQPS